MVFLKEFCGTNNWFHFDKDPLSTLPIPWYSRHPLGTSSKFLLMKFWRCTKVWATWFWTLVSCLRVKEKDYKNSLHLMCWLLWYCWVCTSKFHDLKVKIYNTWWILRKNIVTPITQSNRIFCGRLRSSFEIHSNFH